MERTEISADLVMLKSDKSITDTRNDRGYSVVVCRKRDERFFTEDDTANA